MFVRNLRYSVPVFAVCDVFLTFADQKLTVNFIF
jgi:hypothetical protein